MSGTDRRIATTDHEPAASAPLRHPHGPSSGLSGRLARPHTREDADQRYVAAREAWTDAMGTASSGRPSDLAALAMAQEAYEEALAERERWASSPSVAVPVGEERPSGLDAVVGQELSWRRVQEHERERERAREQHRGLRGLVRRIIRR